MIVAVSHLKEDLHPVKIANPGVTATTTGIDKTIEAAINSQVASNPDKVAGGVGAPLPMPEGQSNQWYGHNNQSCNQYTRGLNSRQSCRYGR
jgi:hypothetical protein